MGRHFADFMDEAMNMKFLININPELRGFIRGALRVNGYQVDDNELIVQPKNNQKATEFEAYIFALLSKAFEENNKEIIDFVGDDDIDDLLDSDLSVEITAVYK